MNASKRLASGIGWLALLGILVLAAPAAAQVLNYDRLQPGQNRISATAGLDPAVLAAVGYTRTVGAGSRPLALSVEVGLPVAALDARDYRVYLGAETWIVRWGSVIVSGRAGAISRGTSNEIFVAHGFGMDLAAGAGYYGTRAFGAVEVGLDKEMVTHISHQDWYRDNAYPGAVNGWYSSGAGAWHAGAAAGIAFGAFETALRAGYFLSEGGNSLDPPFRGTLSVGYVF